ncbi:MAG: DUF1292 domain-containing protein [Acutalibacteraceae bacterium]
MDNEFAPDLITLLDDEGTEHNFEILDVIEEDDRCFLALLPTFDDAEDSVDAPGEYYIFESIVEDDEEQLVEVDDDTLIDRLAEMFEERFESLYDDEEDDDSEL